MEVFNGKNKLERREYYINKAKEIHGDKYDYSKIIFKNVSSKVEIICPKHGSFWQPFISHLEGKGCRRCGYIRKNEYSISSNEEFIKESSSLHNNKYDYSKVNYINNMRVVEIICPKHGSFWQKPYYHLYLGRGCRKCSQTKNACRRTITGIRFKNEAKEIHGDKYDYSLIKDDDNQADLKEFPIICKKCKTLFKQKYAAHIIAKHNCPNCAKDIRREWVKNNLAHTKLAFIEKAQKIHNDYYKYDKVEYVNNRIPVKIKCPKHGYFLQKPVKHLRGRGCKLCNISKGENKIRILLKKINLNFVWQYKVDRFSYDFFIPSLKILIEYDGIQHHKKIKYFKCHEKYHAIVKRDKLKNKLAYLLGYHLIRIKYTDFDNLERVLLYNISKYYKYYYNKKFYPTFLSLSKELNIPDSDLVKDYNKYLVTEVFKEHFNLT